MTTLTLPAQSTGSSTRAVAMPHGGTEVHTVIRYASVASPTIGQHLLWFDLSFDAPDFERLFILVHAEETDLEPASPSTSALSTVELLVARMGVPEKDVLQAAGISRRTFQNWRRNPDTRPRLDSQGDLWGLAQAVEVLYERLGDVLPAWILQDRSRHRLLLRGEFAALVREATRPTERLPEMLHRERHLSAGDFGDDAADLAPRRSHLNAEVAPAATYGRPEDR